MQRIIVVGGMGFRLLLWELLQLSGDVDEICLVDGNDTTPNRSMLGRRVLSAAWLKAEHSNYHRVILSTKHADMRACLLDAGWHDAQLLSAPDSGDRQQLARWVARHFPDPLADRLKQGSASADHPQIGIFGTGGGGRKVWEAAMTFDQYEVTWFADNDGRRQGGRFFGIQVIDPVSIPDHSFTGIAIASMHRAPIAEQLLALGIGRQQIITPDVAAPLAQVNAQVIAALQARGTPDTADNRL